ncbi:hypothetical protein Q7P35_005479 [Cladosporium inversicolor]
MDTHDVYDYGSIDEAIINYVGAAVYDDGLLAQPSARPVSIQADHDLSAEDYHGEPDFSDLLSLWHDVDGLPEDFDFSSHDASVFKDESTPWHPARAYGTPERDLQPKESLDPANQTDVNVGREPGNGLCLACKERDAHSSTNGISQWPDFAMGDDLPECSCTHPPTDSTSPTSPSSSVHLLESGLSQSLSSVTSMSQRDTRAEAARGESAVKESPTSLCTGPAESMGRGDPPHIETPVESFVPEESASNVSASPPNNASAARPHLCSLCGAGFMTRADVRYARPFLENGVTAKDDLTDNSVDTMNSSTIQTSKPPNDAPNATMHVIIGRT